VLYSPLDGGVMAEFWDVLDENGNKTGRLHERDQGAMLNKPVMAVGDFHLIVHVWIVNDKGEFLISKRTPNKSFPNMWECTGGSAVAGDGSLATALKEVREELGISIRPENGQLFKQYRVVEANGGGFFADVWIFREAVDLADVVYQEGETCDAKFAAKDEINEMIDSGSFIGRKIFPYIDELFEFVL